MEKILLGNAFSALNRLLSKRYRYREIQVLDDLLV